MGILDQLKAWTPANDQGRTDFDDAPTAVYRPRVARDMVVIVKGATDLRDAMPTRSTAPSPSAGMVAVDGDMQRRDPRPYADTSGQPTEKQRAFIVNLINELMTVDAAKGEQAAEYTIKMTDNAAWKPNHKEAGVWVKGNTSRWIDTLLTTIKHERAQNVTTAPVSAKVETPTPTHTKPAYDAYDDVTDGNYAIVSSGKTHFYRITRKEGRGQYAGRTFINIQERASDELFPVRGAWATRKALLDSIRAAGVDASHVLYADRLGCCWHCNKTLTDDQTNPYRIYGLGPVCGPKVMG